jgi:hypothetical protein
MLLLCRTESCSEIQGICTEGTHVGQFNTTILSKCDLRIYTISVGTNIVPVLLAMVSFSSFTITDGTRNRKLENCCKILAGKHWTTPTPFVFSTQKCSSLALKEHFSGLRFICDEDARRATITWLNLSRVLSDQTCHTL